MAAQEEEIPDQSREGLLNNPQGETTRKSTAATERKSISGRKTKIEKKKANLPDAKSMKAEVKQNLTITRYDVSDYYYDTGKCQEIATNQNFENLTLGVISFNALWISIDTDYNDAAAINNYEPIFLIMENLFCIYFCFEWVVRFGAFENKLNCFKDFWMIFDTGMVALMVFETWIMFIIIAITGASSGSGGAGSLRLLRLLRLSRMARMAKLLRSMPELLILIKGMVAALRSVVFTLILLFLMMYVFAIFFKQMTEGSIQEDHFPTVLKSIHTLVVYGTMLDSIGSISFGIADADWGGKEYVVISVWYFFVLMSAILLMNMLIGVMCEVITGVAEAEREEMDIVYMGEKLKSIFMKRTNKLSEDKQFDKEMYKDLFQQDEEAIQAFRAKPYDLDVDGFYKLFCPEEVFKDADDPKTEPTTYKFVEDLLVKYRKETRPDEPNPEELIRKKYKDIVGKWLDKYMKNEDEKATFNQEDFLRIFVEPETANVLSEVEVDPIAMVDLVDTIFASEDGHAKSLTFSELLDVMLDHRSSKIATVKDVTNFRKYVRARASRIDESIEKLRTLERDAKINIETQITVLGDMLEGITGSDPGSFHEQSKRLYTAKKKQMSEKDKGQGAHGTAAPSQTLNQTVAGKLEDNVKKIAEDDITNEFTNASAKVEDPEPMDEDGDQGDQDDMDQEEAPQDGGVKKKVVRKKKKKAKTVEQLDELVQPEQEPDAGGE